MGRLTITMSLFFLMTLRNRTYQIKQKALEIGFDDCGSAAVQWLKDEEKHLQRWLRKGMHGTMHYMEQHADKRINPVKLVPGARSVVSVLLKYATSNKQPTGSPLVSKYAYGRDYHKVMKKKLKQLLEFIQEICPGTEGRCFVDSAPMLDRAWAYRAGLGWIGKNSNLISTKHGSFVFIGSVVINQELEYAKPIGDCCGGCNKCVEACPTGAIVAPRIVDGSACISYLTIERQDPIPDKFKGKMRNYIFGCDICQDVCPWNRNVLSHEHPELAPKPLLIEMTKDQWYELSDEEFNIKAAGSALKRTMYSGIRRNLEFIYEE
jgi:epoxyqueuosine reductase